MANLTCNPRHDSAMPIWPGAQGQRRCPGRTDHTRSAYPKLIQGAEQALLIAVWLEIDQTPPTRCRGLSRKILGRMQQTEFNPARGYRGILAWVRRRQTD